ncbi:MAG: phosphatase PAP2 family protein [Clostridia bacterium]|nr:phosphatase PAP2 family protein [Clostridia bacterium]
MLDKIKAIDEKLSMSVAKIHNPVLNKIMLFMTFLGDAGKVWFLLIALTAYFKRSLYIGTSLFLSLALAFISAEVVIKRIFERERPCNKIAEELLIMKKIPNFYSFPSSHSATSFAMVTVTFMLCSTWVTVGVFIIAFGIAFSRFYLQAHYLTDVLCGIAIGIISGILMVKLAYVILNAINPSLVK